jgi:hypothetical protein
MQEFTIERVGLPNLDFSGEVIGQSDGPNPQIKIYRTKAGHYVAAFQRDSKRSDAVHYDQPEPVVNWLKTLSGSITPAAQSAIESAAEHDEGFKKLWNERIE